MNHKDYKMLKFLFKGFDRAEYRSRAVIIPICREIHGYCLHLYGDEEKAESFRQDVVHVFTRLCDMPNSRAIAVYRLMYCLAVIMKPNP